MANDIVIENVRVIYRNFSGTPTQYNKNGRREFSVVIDEPLAITLLDEGWNVKPLKKRDETEPQMYHLPIDLGAGKYPPKIVLLSGKRKVILEEPAFAELDVSDIEFADVLIHPRVWEDSNGGRKIKAYLRSGYFKIRDNPLDEKFANYGLDEDTPF